MSWTKVLNDIKESIEDARSKSFFTSEEKNKLQEAERKIASVIETDNVNDPLRFYEGEKRVELNGEDLNLGLAEFELFELLKRHERKAFTRQQLLEKVFASGSMENDIQLATERTVDAHIRGIRSKLGEHSGCIQTVRGVGYRYVSDYFSEQSS